MGRPLVVVDYSRLLTQHKHATDGALIELRTLRDLQHVRNVTKFPTALVNIDGLLESCGTYQSRRLGTCLLKDHWITSIHAV